MQLHPSLKNMHKHKHVLSGWISYTLSLNQNKLCTKKSIFSFMSIYRHASSVCVGMWWPGVTVAFSCVRSGEVLKASWPGWHTFGRLCPAPLHLTQKNNCGCLLTFSCIVCNFLWVCKGKCTSQMTSIFIPPTRLHTETLSQAKQWRNVACLNILSCFLCSPLSYPSADSVGQTLVHTLCILSDTDTPSQTRTQASYQ